MGQQTSNGTCIARSVKPLRVDRDWGGSPQVGYGGWLRNLLNSTPARNPTGVYSEGEQQLAVSLKTEDLSGGGYASMVDSPLQIGRLLMLSVVSGIASCGFASVVLLCRSTGRGLGGTDQFKSGGDGQF